MTDIKKLIEYLKDMEAKAWPGTWIVDESDYSVLAMAGDGEMQTIVPALDDCVNPDDNEDNARLIVAMRNARPELLLYFRDEYTAEDEQEPPVLARYWLSRASEFLQEAGFEEASKALDCEYEL